MLSTATVQSTDVKSETDTLETLDLDDTIKALEGEWNEEALTATPKALTAFWDASHDGFHDFLVSIGKIPLLREKELPTARLARQYVDFLEAVDNARTKLQQDGCSDFQKRQVWAEAGYSDVDAERLLTQGKRAAQRMVECNLRLVVAVAKKYSSPQVSIEDRVQEGTKGLMRAVEKFDPDKGYKFSTYAHWWIRQAITRSIAEQKRSIRLPLHVTEKLNRIGKVTHELKQSLQRTPTEVEIAAACELKVASLQTLRQHQQSIRSLNELVGEQQDGTELMDLVRDDQRDSEEQTDQALLAETLTELLETLEPKARAILRLRYGLEDGQTYTLSKIGEKLNLSRERVRQIEQKALQKLRKQKKALSDFFQ